MVHCPESCVDAGALELLQKGELPADHWDWESGAGFRFKRDEDLQEESAVKATLQRYVPLLTHFAKPGADRLLTCSCLAWSICLCAP